MGESLEADVEFNTDLFDTGTIDRMFGNLAACLESAIAEPEEKVAEISILTPAERHQLLFEWNDTEREYPRDTPLAALVEAQVERTPDAVGPGIRRASGSLIANSTSAPTGWPTNCASMAPGRSAWLPFASTARLT